MVVKRQEKGGGSDGKMWLSKEWGMIHMQRPIMIVVKSTKKTICYVRCAMFVRGRWYKEGMREMSRGE